MTTPTRPPGAIDLSPFSATPNAATPNAATPDAATPDAATPDAATLATWMRGRTYVDRKPLPALAPDAPALAPERQAVLLAVYTEVCNGSRALTDVRFKLLGLLPVVSLSVLITLLGGGDGAVRLSPAAQTAVAALGLGFTAAVRLYDRRNTMLYNDLVGRGRQIEAELGVHTGHFRGRPDSRGMVKHDIAMRLVYGLAALAWVVTAVAPWTRALSDLLAP